jgi:hypothetical protein
MKAVVDQYLSAAGRGDGHAMAKLFSDDGRIIDPIGAEPLTGSEAIRSFFAAPRDVKRVERLGPITAFGHWVGFQFRAELGPERGAGLPPAVVLTEIMRFDDAGKIIEMIAIPDVSAAELPVAGSRGCGGAVSRSGTRR